ncbi:MAG: DUF393 domain-containing protein [Opitutaceae bacterium]|nr:DUF393 domain-containing protein [Verrucomicrobiales bacterium]
MKLFIRGGRVLGGADAVVELGKCIWMFRPVVWIAAVPGGRRFLKWGYGWAARHRRCAPGSCRVPQAFTSGRTRTL